MLLRALTATTLATAALAAPAAAATVDALKPCYASDGPATTSARRSACTRRGFTPEAPLDLYIDGLVVAQGMADEFGETRATVPRRSRAGPAGASAPSRSPSWSATTPASLRRPARGSRTSP